MSVARKKAGGACYRKDNSGLRRGGLMLPALKSLRVLPEGLSNTDSEARMIRLRNENFLGSEFWNGLNILQFFCFSMFTVKGRLSE